MTSRRRPKPHPQPAPEPRPEPTPKPGPRPDPVPPRPQTVLGSYGNASIDVHDAAFGAGSEVAKSHYGVEVDPLILKAMMHVESGGDGTYPADKCRPKDSYDDVPACGPMQIKQKYHQAKCPDCDFSTVAGQVALAACILAEWRKRTGKGDIEAITAVYFPGADENGTTQAGYVAKVKQLVKHMERNAKPPKPEPVPDPTPSVAPWAVMFGNAAYRMGDFGWLTPTQYQDYAYGVGHGTTAANLHTGQDVLAAYGTDYFALGAGKVVCVGRDGTSMWGQGCGYFADTGDAGPGSTELGVGNITVLYDTGVKVTTGHSRRAFVPPGQRVERGTKLGTVGGMRGAHLHVDTVVERNGAYWLLDPAEGLPKAIGGEKPSPKPAPLTFGKVPRPTIVGQIVDKPQGAGWWGYGPRDLLLAIVLHNVLGNASTTGQYFSTFVPPDGGHGWGALTDWGVCNSNDGPGWDGKILKWNDPDGPRSPYASGGYGTPTGDGPAFIALCQRVGRNINQVSEAIEISRRTNTAAVSAACLRSIIALTAYRVDRKAKVAWNVWPKNNHGIQMILTHQEMGKPECNAIDMVSDVIDGVRDLLREYQGQGEPVPDPTPDPRPKPRRWLDEMDLPEGVTEAFLARRFGRWVAPSKAVFAFDGAGIVSQVWAQRGVATGEYPELEIVEDADGTALFVFEGGLVVNARAGRANILKAEVAS